MNILYLLHRTSYVLAHEGSWYRFERPQDIDLSLTLMPLEIMDEYEHPEQPHQAGCAVIEPVEVVASTAPIAGGSDAEASEALVRCELAHSTFKVTFTRPDGKLISTVNLVSDPSCLETVEWPRGKFKDGWINAEAEIHLEGLQSYMIRAYLPRREGSEGKVLRITDNATKSVREVTLTRDAVTEVPLFEGTEKYRLKFRLDCDAEPVDGSADARALGFLLIQEPKAA